MRKVKRTAHTSKAPTVIRHCRKCGTKSEYASTGSFRVNAQRKSLDVWLIYKCTKCNTTWNLTILSRVTPGAILPELLRGFHENDTDLAMTYATDKALLKRNGAEPGQTRLS